MAGRERVGAGVRSAQHRVLDRGTGEVRAEKHFTARGEVGGLVENAG